ncbi:hypothetical protein BJ138DRAFT_1103092 [Hygrophoropsis aurantiaca]|uniref:Uncharacterized protein n=1 Tax=Hygrophoropsis aurantiaca TaxID=72124 RepID=A0ACB8A613_9AGAM|nr:hypothetical protein BJ138DRAFT_1103092 [Hygrophoropsis aurantiaca]
MAATLPTETWTQILHNVPRENILRCTSVCQSWHTVGTRIIFRHIRLYFGNWIKCYEQGDGGVSRAQAARLQSRSTEILAYIAQNPDTEFVRAVKRISVYAYENEYVSVSDSDSESSEEGLDQCDFDCLRVALEHLPHLQSFDWIATFVPASQSHRDSILESFAATAANDNNHDDNNDNDPAIDLGQLFCAQAPLRRLQLVENISVPAQIVGGLTELILVHPMDANDIASLLPHALRLESLGLYNVQGLDVYTVLQTHAGADILPLLSSFALSSSLLHDMRYVQAIQDFLQGRTARMRRLLLNIDCEWDHFSQLLPVISKMTHLDALGLANVACDIHRGLSMGKIKRLVESVPRATQALILSIEGLDANKVLQTRLSELPHLKFLYMFGRHPLPLYQVPTIRVLHERFPRVTTMGLENHFWSWQCRGPGSESDVVQWSNLKLDTRALDDFDCEHEEWLMRFNTFLAEESPLDAVGSFLLNQ